MAPEPPGERTEPAATRPGRRRRRRRRHGPGEGGEDARGAEGVRGRPGPGPDVRGSARRGRDPRRPRRDPPAVPVVPAVSHLAEPAPGDEPLSAGEIAEMKEHLAFLRDYKSVLRLRLNAAEDLLVNGRREPTERGVCRHLLGKIDRALIEAAVAREPLRSDPAARARMLAGAIRVTADLGVLLAYLETLTHVRARGEAARAFAEVVRRIDFESLSTTRLARLLQILIDTFTDHERVQVLFSLLAGDAFRRAFDTAAPGLPPEVAEICEPLRAVHRRLVSPLPAARGVATPEAPAGDTAGPDDAAGPAPEDAERLAAGMEQVLAAPDPVLRGYGEPLRVRLLALALEPWVPAALADRASGVLLGSLDRRGRTYGRLAMRRAAQLLARHADDRARSVLEDVRRAAPDFRQAERWLAALDSRRLGRIAVGAEPEPGRRLLPAFWLDGQREVWVRTAVAPAAERLATEAALQAALALPMVASVVEHGVASAIPYVAVAVPAGPGRLHPAADVDLAGTPARVAAVLRLLRALALAGVRLPGAEPARFLVDGALLVLADCDGVVASPPADAAVAHAALGTALVASLMPHAHWRDAEAEPPGAPDLVALIAWLDRLTLARSS